MPTQRNFYQAQAVFVGPTPATGAHYESGNSGDNSIVQLHRVQTVGFNASVNRQDINQLGRLARLSSEIIDQPDVSLNMSYYATNVLNEQRLGLTPVDGTANFISGILNGTQEEKNYFVSIVEEGNDAEGYDPSAGVVGVVGIGNGFINSYSFDAAVGGLANVSIGVEGLNLKYYNDYSGEIPAVNPTDGTEITDYFFQVPTATSGVVGQETALRYGDITLTLTNDEDVLGIDVSDAKIQSCNIGVQLSRTPQNKLGSRFAVARPIQFPVPVSFSFDAELGDITTGSIADLLCNDKTYEAVVTLRRPECTGNGAIAMRYTLKGLKLDSHDFNSSIGPNSSVSVNMSCQLAGPGDQTQGLFLSGELS